VTGNLQSKTLAIDDLIRRRCRELGLSSAELIWRCGYENVSMGLRRLEQLGSGEFDRAAGLIRALPSGLEVTWERVEQAIESSKRQLRDAEEAAWRRSFKPHAIILTERSIPQATLSISGKAVPTGFLQKGLGSG
jgi:hypothetical protein